MQNSYCDHRNFDSVNEALLQIVENLQGNKHSEIIFSFIAIKLKLITFTKLCSN
jgi:hypothetical protein